MYSVTTFTWKDGFPQTVIPAYQGICILLLDSFSIKMSGRSAQIQAGFTSAMDPRDAIAFVAELRQALGSPAEINQPWSLKYCWNFNDIEAGDDLGVAEWMMRKYIKFFEFCGVQPWLIPVPRLVTEFFLEGRYDGDPASIPSGQFLLNKVLLERQSAGAPIGELVKR